MPGGKRVAPKATNVRSDGGIICGGSGATRLKQAAQELCAQQPRSQGVS